MKCRQLTQLISKHQENPLTLLEQGQVYLHLAMCPYCRAFHKNCQKTRSPPREVNLISTFSLHRKRLH